MSQQPTPRLVRLKGLRFRTDPNNARLARDVMDLALQEGDFDFVLEHASAKLVVAPDDVRAMFDRASSLIQEARLSGRHRSARRVARSRSGDRRCAKQPWALLLRTGQVRYGSRAARRGLCGRRSFAGHVTAGRCRRITTLELRKEAVAIADANPPPPNVGAALPGIPTLFSTSTWSSRWRQLVMPLRRWRRTLIPSTDSSRRPLWMPPRLRVRALHVNASCVRWSWHPDAIARGSAWVRSICSTVISIRQRAVSSAVYSPCRGARARGCCSRGFTSSRTISKRPEDAASHARARSQFCRSTRCTSGCARHAWRSGRQRTGDRGGAPARSEGLSMQFARSDAIHGAWRRCDHCEEDHR